jgi:hypothetical protein
VIIEAFAEYLHAADQSLPATEVLATWIKGRLDSPVVTQVDRVMHCEISFAHRFENGSESHNPKTLAFRGLSKSGRILLKSLYEYCQSYEQQKWARYIHRLKASDFSAEELRDSG